ncbi:MAG: hypothetical protein ABJA82_09520 [Myxococcales bacterium]
MSTPNDTGPCPSDFGLERWRLGELAAAGDDGRVHAAHVERCATCADRLRELAASPPLFPLDAVWRAARGERGVASTSRAGGWRRLGPRWLAGMLAGAAAVAATAVMLARSVPSTDLVKGGPFALTVIAQRKGKVGGERIPSGTRLSPGDRLRFEVSTTRSSAYIAVVSLDSAGVVSPLAPFTGETVEIHAGRPALLDGAVALDQATGPERVELLGCVHPAPVTSLIEAARGALKRAGGDLRKLERIAPGCDSETFWIEKTTP